MAGELELSGKYFDVAILVPHSAHLVTKEATQEYFKIGRSLRIGRIGQKVAAGCGLVLSAVLLQNSEIQFQRIPHVRMSAHPAEQQPCWFGVNADNPDDNYSFFTQIVIRLSKS